MKIEKALERVPYQDAICNLINGKTNEVFSVPELIEIFKTGKDTLYRNVCHLVNERKIFRCQLSNCTVYGSKKAIDKLQAELNKRLTI